MSAPSTPRSFHVLSSLKWPAIVIAILAVAGAVVGYLVSGIPGMISGLLGAAMWLLFLALTAVSIQVAIRATKDDPGSPVFFAIVLGSWVLKLVLFVVLLDLAALAALARSDGLLRDGDHRRRSARSCST